MSIVWLEAFLLVLALGFALLLRPWRMLQGDGRSALATPMLATLALLPFVWAVPYHGTGPFVLSASGAALVVLMVGWPLAIPLLATVGFVLWRFGALPLADALAITVWLGVVPASLALAVGHLLRRCFGAHPLAYLAGRAYFGTMACSLAGTVLVHALHGPAGPVSLGDLLALSLLAVVEGSVTAAVVVLLVACLPRALATWSDRLYLRPAAPLH